MSAAGLITGIGEGLNNTILVGIAYDTRDFEPDPNNGIFAEALLSNLLPQRIPGIELRFLLNFSIARLILT